jgi:hypothetical protein
VSYMVKCALPAGRSITKQDASGASYTFPGSLGVAPEWESGSCGADCQKQMTACMMAHINTTGQHIALWLDGDSSALGWGQNANYPFQEGSFFGNIFTSPPTAYYCEGRDFDRGVVHGRLGADQNGAPYSNLGGTGTPCSSVCVAADSPHQADGYKSCGGYNHVVTVWRDFDPTTAYTMVNRNTHTAAEVSGFSTSDLANVQAWAPNGGKNQQWKIQRVSAGLYKIVNVNSNKCLDVAGASTSSGANVEQYTCNGGKNQLWRIVPKGAGYYQIRTELTNTSSSPNCLDIYSVSGANGANVQSFQCDVNGGVAQQWKVDLATP